jgi:2-polyprenyl-3-methyl-5-hydroxy-6-metoxy-1,4-benzoquinol methylase
MIDDYRARLYSSYVRTHIGEKSLEHRLTSRAPYLNRVVQAYFPPQRSANILELGCGNGALLYLAQRAGYSNLRGIDVSEQQVAEAHKLGIDFVRQGDLMETLARSADESVDFVIAFDVIEHFSKRELLGFVDQVRRVLHKGGQWLLHQPNAASPFFGRIRYGDYTHEQAFTVSSITQLMLAGGFHSVACYEDVPVVHGAKSMLRYILWRFIRIALRLYLAAETGTSREIFTQNFLAVATK